MELKPIERTDRSVSRLNAALSIYRQTILPEAQNPERQILYWIDHSKDTLADEFRCFAIQDRNSVVGYFQYSYFREENIFFFEYLCIKSARLTGMVPSAAIDEIGKFLTRSYPAGFIIVFEVAQKRLDGSQWRPDQKLIRYFIRLGFRRLTFDYHYPILQSYDGATSYPADLMVSLPSGRKTITAFELRTTLRCIYFKHYLRWDRPFLEPDRFRERERLINDLYARQIASISRDDQIGTTGDDKHSRLSRFVEQHASGISALLSRIFGPKFPRLVVVILMTLGVQWLLGSRWFLLPFVLAVAALYCLAEDTASSRKLLVAIISRFPNATPRSS